MQYSYYDLIDNNKLPPNSKFVDPYDHTAFTPLSQTENLNNFIERILQHRKDEGFPELFKTDLHHLVLSSLYESSTPDQRKTHFQIKTAPPTLSNLLSLSRTIAAEAIHSNNVSAKHREERAKKCGAKNDPDKCKFHNTSSSWPTTLKNLIVKVVGLDKLNKSEAENHLGNCMMCGGCALQPKVRFEVMSILAGLAPESIDKLIGVYGIKAFDKCWILQDAINNPRAREILTRKLANGRAKGDDLLKAYLMNKEMKALAPKESIEALAAKERQINREKVRQYAKK